MYHCQQGRQLWQNTPRLQAKFKKDAGVGLGQCKAPPQADYSITGMENSPPSLIPDGQREVIVLVLV